MGTRRQGIARPKMFHYVSDLTNDGIAMQIWPRAVCNEVGAARHLRDQCIVEQALRFRVQCGECVIVTESHTLTRRTQWSGVKRQV